MQTVMDKKIIKAQLAVKEADNALKEAIMAERTAKGQSLTIRKPEPKNIQLKVVKQK